MRALDKVFLCGIIIVILISFAMIPTVVLRNPTDSAGRALNYNFTTFTHESCEYVVIGNGASVSMVHKQNCLFCEDRARSAKKTAVAYDPR